MTMQPRRRDLLAGAALAALLAGCGEAPDAKVRAALADLGLKDVSFDGLSKADASTTLTNLRARSETHSAVTVARLRFEALDGGAKAWTARKLVADDVRGPGGETIASTVSVIEPAATAGVPRFKSIDVTGYSGPVLGLGWSAAHVTLRQKPDAVEFEVGELRGEGLPPQPGKAGLWGRGSASRTPEGLEVTLPDLVAGALHFAGKVLFESTPTVDATPRQAPPLAGLVAAAASGGTRVARLDGVLRVSQRPGPGSLPDATYFGDVALQEPMRRLRAMLGPQSRGFANVAVSLAPRSPIPLVDIGRAMRVPDASARLGLRLEPRARAEEASARPAQP